MNTGLLAIGFSLVLGRLNGIPDKEVINGFNYSLFMILLGVTYLFSLAQLNGSLELLAKKVVALAGKHTFMIPIVIYVFSVVLSALGPGTRRCVTAGSDRHYRYQSLCRLRTDRH